jgi:hypothetical protein
MKKLILALGLCLILITLLAVPAMAGPSKKIAFTTGLSSDGVTLEGSLDAGFKYVGGGDAVKLNDIKLVSPTADPALTNGMYAFYLKPNQSTASTAQLKAYFAAKGWGQDYLNQINAEIDGIAPFFYLKATSGSYSLVDGFVYAVSNQTVEVTLRINDDYPAGLYFYTGTLTNANGDFDITVKLKVK